MRSPYAAIWIRCALMCGIAGLVGHELTPQERSHRCRLMALALAHRGPDDHGLWSSADAPVTLGHQRLSIVDTSAAGHQPMTSQDGRWTIVFNGEIYNAAELARSLHGISMQGHSDTEVFLELIAREGIQSALRRSVGMFALAVWDAHERTLSLARDRLGIKPIYVGRWQRGLAFASELRAFHALPEIDDAVSPDGLASLLRLGYVAGAQSILRGINKIEPGMLLTVRLGNGCMEEQHTRWWSVERALAEPLQSMDDREAIEGVRAAIEVSVRDRLVSDRPLGAFLSGGVDSSLVVATMGRVSREPVETFSIGFEHPEWDESAYARAAARHLGTRHHEQIVTEQDVLDVVPQLGGLFDEPFADSSQIPTLLVCQLARSHVVVALSGDGGDELFGGYTRYAWTMRLWNRLARIPRPVRCGMAIGLRAIPDGLAASLARAANFCLPATMRVRNPSDKAMLVEQLLGARDPGDLYRTMIGHWKHPEQLMVDPPSISSSFYPPSLSIDPWMDMMTADMRQYLPGDILTKVDRTSMSVGLEARVPLLDHRVVELAIQLPLHMKVRQGQGKWVLRQILGDMVPASCWDRPKMGFGVPLGAWLRGPLRDWAEALLCESRLHREGYFRAKPIRQTWRQHLSGRIDHGAYLWNILMFQAWLESRGQP